MRETVLLDIKLAIHLPYEPKANLVRAKSKNETIDEDGIRTHALSNHGFSELKT